jgi:hypothetical protein
MIIYMQDFSPIFLKLQNTDFKKFQKPGSREPGIQNDALDAELAPATRNPNWLDEQIIIPKIR